MDEGARNLGRIGSFKEWLRTKRWFRPYDTATCIADISFHHQFRPVGRIDGVGFLISKLFKVNLHNSLYYSSF